MRIAVGQISCILGDGSANVEKLRDFAARAAKAGANLVVFPEMADTGYSMPVIRRHATAWSQGAVPELRKMARALSIAVICGVSERDGALIYNSQIFLDEKGETVGRYRKTHLFSSAPIEEDKCFSAGNRLESFPMGDLHFGLSICYDLRFPEVYRRQAVEGGVDTFVISSAWPFPRVEHLRILATARAIENQSYLILANRAGADDGITFCGNSTIIDPYGVVVAGASADREELLVAEISVDVIRSVRERMPVFAHRRPELYGKGRG